MRCKTLVQFIFLLLPFAAGSQCIDPEQVHFSAEWDHKDDIWLCATYTFTYDGNGWSDSSTLHYPVNMKLAPPEVPYYKRYVDSVIRAYAGEDFCSRLFFREVDVVYSDSFANFADVMGGPTKCCCRAKYNFYYEFRADSIALQFIPILLDSNGVILHEFPFPSRAEYQPIDTNFTYCKLIRQAQKTQKGFGDADRITFEYNSVEKRYYWRIEQDIVNYKVGANNCYEAIVDASDLTKVKILKTVKYIYPNPRF